MPQTDRYPLIEIELERLREPPYHEILFGSNPAPVPELLPDTVIKVRPLDAVGRAYEIVAGVERCRAARGRGVRAVHAFVVEMSAEEARLHATDDFLRNAAYASARSVVQLLVAAKDNEALGGDWRVERLTALLGIKKSTYTHAWSSVAFVCEQLRRSDPEAANLGLAEQVALAVRSNFLPEFTELYAGRMSVNRFYRQVYQSSEVGRERSRRQREAKGRSKDQAGAAPHSPAASGNPGRLIAEAVLKLAQAATVSDGDRIDEHTLDQQLVTLLDSHAGLEAAVRQICRQLLNHLDSSHGRARLKPTRSTSPAGDDVARQLSLDLFAAAGESEAGHDHDAAHAA